MKLLWVATKSPWPPVDGGRLLMWETLRLLAGRGHRVTLVAPVDAGLPSAERAAIADHLGPVCEPRLVARRPPGLLRATLQGLLAGRAATLVRHRSPEVAEAARRVASGEALDAVVAEQLQAYPQARAAAGDRLPVVVRAQNVESDLWAAAAARARLARPLLRLQARALARDEGRLLGEADAVVAVSRRDAERLREIASLAAEPEVIYPPFPDSLPAGETRLEGAPSLVALGSEGWAPNRDATDWLVAELWPAVRRALPDAALHVFGAPSLRGDRLYGRPAPGDSADAFAPGSILIVPLRVASGIRIKVLEAWARGVPVITTRVGARGLPDGAEEAVGCADDAVGLVAEVRRLLAPDEVARRVDAGRRLLRRHHHPEEVGRRLEALLHRVGGAFQRSPRSAGDALATSGAETAS